MCIRMYERCGEHEKHRESMRVMLFGFQEIWGIREIKWERGKREKMVIKYQKFKLKSSNRQWKLKK